MIILFVGRVRIIAAAQRDDDALPFTVEVLDDETNEQDERLERDFKTAEEADAYAKYLTRLSPASGLMVPIVPADEPRTRWSVSAVVSVEM